ncbi:hypothetical protein [Nocardia sp. NBC_01329]|uniref:hypothetical protein n=1 Tax=Nocardia sp. NBC_01329 TaxID=2903594 RepID=UPI002E0D959A|nr:hypothetical protein OG405_15125 [Nocardia sp. NBC_01329]
MRRLLESKVTDFYYKVNPDGARTASIGDCFNGARADAERVLEPLTGIFLEHLGGAIATVSPDATSFHGRDPRY